MKKFPMYNRERKQKIQKTTHTQNFFWVFLRILCRPFALLRQYVRRQKAQYRVQKMLKNNFVVKQQHAYVPLSSVASQNSRRTFSFVPPAYRGFAAVFVVSFLILTILTSQYYGPAYIEAEIAVQNFTQTEANVQDGITLLAYDTRSEE
ncbi:MAG: hypothetical protein CR954_00285, partial [Candidatus Moraniibacteriota bacterium]